jgi:UDPglucose 6-dehydrogenase
MGHVVSCLDVDETRIGQLGSGICPIHEIGIEDLLRSGLQAGRLQFGTDPAVSIADADFVFLCVPTPSSEDGSANLEFLHSAATAIAPHLRSGAVVINKSTVPVGAVAYVKSAIGRSDIAVASNPEFLREGTAVHDFLHPDRVVIGSEDPRVAERVASLFEAIDAPVVVTDPISAELIKYASNAYLATRLTFVNEIARLCDDFGANASDVLGGMGLDRRIGPSFLVPGPGWGGSCFPKDTAALLHSAQQVGDGFPLLDAALATNESHFERIVTKLSSALERPLSGATIAVWGLAFKAGTDDTRESPSVEIIDRLLARGAKVNAFDPVVASLPDRGDQMVFASSELEAIDGADGLLVLTEWAEFADVDPVEVTQRLSGKVVVDGRNLLDAAAYRSAGVVFVGLGQ